MSKISLFIVLFLMLVAAIVFTVDPQIDLQTTAHFYLPINNFTLIDAHWAGIARSVLYVAVYGVGILFFILLLIKIFRPRLKISMKFLIYSLAVFILVPALLINAGLKDHVHRPRPRDVQQFGGTLQFQPVGVISQECDVNCSFVCGDAAVVFTFWAFLPFFRRRSKFAYGTVVFLVGSMYGYIRIGQGGHFLSDVIFAGLITYVAVWLIYWFFYRLNLRWLNEDKLENLTLKAHQRIFRQQ